MRRGVVLAVIVLALACPAAAIPADDGELAGYYGVDLWGLAVDAYGPVPAAHYYVPGVLTRAAIRGSLELVTASDRTDIVSFQDSWIIVYYFGDGRAATAIMLPR